MLGDAPNADDSFVAEDLCQSDPAILQYSSGSTSTPKGVVLTHGNVIANERQIQQAVQTGPEDIVLSWLPPFHDMGLLGGILHPLFVGVRGVLMAPDAFIRKPVRWLRATSEYRASVLVAPNFAYDLCVRRIKPSDREGLDLSSVRVALCGAEPISGTTLDSFCNAYEPHGFDRRAIYPCYGLAEASIFVTGGTPGAGWNADRFEPHGLDVGLALGCQEGAEHGRELVSCGRPADGTEVRIVDPRTRSALPARNVGEIWLRGPSIAGGYWRRPLETAESFDAQLAAGADGRFLRTGDLGFMRGGELFVTGRRKDLIIIRGRNHYPQDIERTVQGIDGSLVADGGAAFAIDGDGGDGLVVVQELDRRGGANADEMLGKAFDAIVDGHGVTPEAIVLIRRGTLQKTASGKVRRAATRARFEADELDEVARTEPGQPRGHHPSTAAETGPGRAMTVLPPAPAVELDTDALRPLAALAQDAKRAASNDYELAGQVAGDPSGQQPVTNSPAASGGADARTVEAHLRQTLAARCGLHPSEIDADATLAAYGLDSLAIAELTEGLEELVGRTLPAEFAYDHPTLRALAHAAANLDADPFSSRADRGAGLAIAGRERGNCDVAVVGLGCRTPGAQSPRELWKLLREGTDALEGGPARAGAASKGGFLSDVAGFDANFFGISRREAERMDPRQRLLLEVAWEALEDAGIDPKSLSDSETGVFVGACGNDYATHFVGMPDIIDADFASGNASSVIANRLSYVLNLKGPSLTLDSACASSLAAVHAARQAITSGTCDLAIVGGVNLILSPETTVAFEHARALSASGRCRPFSSDADGFVRAEAVGVVILQRADQAAACGRPVRALVTGSAVNHNGRSNGLMAPNGQAQQRVIERAHATAGVLADAIDYVEAHGVGAPIADAIETAALGAVLGRRQRKEPCWLGSIKSNIGHTEAAAGVISLIKTTLCLEHGLIPQSLHFQGAPPKVSLAAHQLRVADRAVPWPRGGRERMAGVSAFGFGGANAHVVVKEAPEPALPERRDRMAHLALLSAQSPAALGRLARRVAARMDGDVPLGDLCHTLNAGRAHMPYRAAIVATDDSGLHGQLEALAAHPESTEPATESEDGTGHGMARTIRRTGHAPRQAPSLGVIFGDGPPIPHSTLIELWQTMPSARDVFAGIDRQTAEATGASWLQALQIGTGELPALGQAQASLVNRHAWQRCQWQLLMALGLQPNVVAGIGAGAIAAACAAHRLSWRHGLQWLLHATGAPMPETLAVGVTTASTSPAAANIHLVGSAPPTGPSSAGGGPHAMAAWTKGQLNRHGAEATPLAPAQRDVADREAFSRSLRALAVDVALDLDGESLDLDGRILQRPLLPADLPAWTALLDTAGVLFTQGLAPDLSALDRPFGFRMASLPTYPFEHERFWVPARKAQRSSLAERSPAVSTVVPARLSGHPLLRKAKATRRHLPSDDTRNPQVKAGA